MVWYDMVWCGVVWYGMVWYGVVWYGIIRYDVVAMVWCCVVWYGVVLCGMIWCGVVWCGVVWNDDFYSYSTPLDTTPPVISNCPADATKQTDLAIETVSWNEPTFSDNVGVTHKLQTKTSGSQFRRGTTIVHYIAFDAAGNSANCSFKVTVKGMVNSKAITYYWICLFIEI